MGNQQDDRHRLLLLHRWLLITLVVVTALHMHTAEAAPAPEKKKQQKQMVPCMYIFGDSLVDNGNNNNILSLARANYRPYGVDFPSSAASPPGRFTNGRTVVDILAGLLGFQPPFIPAHAMAAQDEYARGLNFASGAAGVRPETGNNLGGHYPLADQVEHFRAVADQLTSSSSPEGKKKMTNQLGKCIYYVGMGSNDYLNNYFMPDYYSTARDYDPAAYAAALLQEYSRQINVLYDLGARKIVVAGVGQIGCIPYELARINDGSPPPNTVGNGAGIGIAVPGITISLGGANRRRSNNNVCNEEINNAIAIYNKGLLSMVKRLNRQLPGAKLVFLDAVSGGRDLVVNAGKYGFTVVDKGCCGVGRNNGQITCLPMQRPCEDRSQYIFWDAFHPTEAANRIIAARAFGSAPGNDAYPFNISRLATL
ncbi:GDSL esterase/lipase At1g33811 [Brachypodium distachyon]|uniref:GDSL esterase/lipase n=1 Tax=Brachypodium distachyon TaxID=15368 RepID=I1HC85_BRADI|nr:GDSL esterase/lipase At1g33811 [Brachypodium distachyon]KQK02803.2 hypothetical protein BRADI_2g03807v3 [Brachypodium distachyon]|eukprot:XP_014755213.1 GDSL esterase/lipase At1g33811 [Brachypodium distachyon]